MLLIFLHYIIYVDVTISFSNCLILFAAFDIHANAIKGSHNKLCTIHPLYIIEHMCSWCIHRSRKPYSLSFRSAAKESTYKQKHMDTDTIILRKIVKCFYVSLTMDSSLFSYCFSIKTKNISLRILSEYWNHEKYFITQGANESILLHTCSIFRNSLHSHMNISNCSISSFPWKRFLIQHFIWL